MDSDAFSSAPGEAAQWVFTQEYRPSVPGTALISKVFALIDAVGAAPNLVTVPELKRTLGWSRPTLYRILAAATAHGYLRFDPIAQGYTLGYRLLDLAQNVWAAPDLAAVASAELRRLRDMTGETAYLAVRQDEAVLGIGKFESPHAIRSAAQLGVRKPLHCTSQGKAILAFLPGAETLVDRLPLQRFTTATITETAALRAELATVRERGYAIENEEIVPGQRCVGAPVLDAEGYPAAAISVAAPVWRLTPERAVQLGPEIARIGRVVGLQLRTGEERVRTSASNAYPHPLVREPAFYGSDPTWMSGEAEVRWIDRLAPCLHVTGLEQTAIVRPSIESPIEAASLDDEPVLALGGQIIRLDPATGAVEGEAAGAPSALSRDPRGRLWAAWSAQDSVSRLGCIDGEGPGWTVQAAITAMAWDGETLYAADPTRGTIYRLQGVAVRVFARLPAVSGEPRGLAVDSYGRLWAALYDGWSIVRLDADGEINRVVALPVPRPTGLAFSGDGTAIVTTARVGLDMDVLERAPLSGRLLVVDVGLSTSN